MLIVRIMGGLGNQMFQYALGKSIELKTNRSLKLDISFFNKQNLRNYELGSFKIKESFASSHEIGLLPVDKFINKIKAKIGLPVKHPKGYFNEEIFGFFYHDLFYQTNHIYLDGYWQNERYFSDIKPILIEDFTPKNEISTVAKSYLKAINSCNSISLHVRRGDYVSNQHTNSFHGICEVSYYHKAVSIIEQYIHEPKYFIFSDDIDWCKRNFHFLDNKIFIESVSAIEDLELMKNCKHNIIANSTFSWWGAWLGNFTGKIVIAPDRWFADENMQKQVSELIPRDWIKI